MKTVNLLTLVIFLFCGTSLAQTNWMDWRYGKPGIQVVTNAPSRAEHAALSNTVAGISGVSLGTVTSLIAEAVGPLASTNTVNATNALFSAWFSGLQSRTSYWDTAYSWGDWSAAVGANMAAIRILETNTVTRADTNGWETGSHASFLTSAPPQSVVSVNGQTGAVVITAAGIGALTNETDVAALRTYHYGSPNIIESPADWFVFDGAGTIIQLAYQFGRENVVIPWEIGGVAVTTIGGNAFSGQSSILSITFPSSVTTIGSESFYDCSSLESLVFNGSAPSMYFGLLGNASPSIIVKNPTATGWGRVVSDGEGSIPILRPVVFTDALTLNGVTYTNLPDVSGLATTQSVNAVAGGLDLAAITLNNHTDNGAIGYDGHLVTGDRALIDSVPGLTQSVAAVSGAFAGFTNSIPAAGCSVLSMTDETNLVVTGATYSYTAQVATNYWLSIAPTAPAYHYSLTVYGTNACTLADNMRLIGTKTVTGTNCVAFKPFTNGLWEVLWGGK